MGGSRDGPWPGQVPPPAPMLVHRAPAAAELVDPAGMPATVTSQGLLATSPARLSIDGGPWAEVCSWAGPWPLQERWWSGSHQRRARMQVVTADGSARLLVAERRQWWVEATYA